jgi:hypothetical protein
MSSFSWPSTTGGSSSNASIGPNGSTAPSSSTEVAGVNPSGNLQPLQTDASGYLYVSLAGAGVEPIPVSQSGVWNITNITGTVSLPTGASTLSAQTAGNTSLASILANQTNGTQTVSILNFPGTQPISGTVTVVQPTAADLNATVTGTIGATQSGTWNITDISGTISLPTGASTNSLQITGNTSLATIATNTATGNTSLASILANQTNGTQTTSLVAGTAVIGTAIVEPRNGTLTDDSGTTSGTPSTSTQIMASNTSRRYLLIENVSTTATIWINFTSAASATSASYSLLPGGSIVQESGFVSTEAVNVLSTTASVPYVAKQA